MVSIFCSFSAIQFHPNAFSDGHFTEYAKILDFLIAEGWTFMLPAEYVAMTLDEKKWTFIEPQHSFSPFTEGLLRVFSELWKTVTF